MFLDCLHHGGIIPYWGFLLGGKKLIPMERAARSWKPATIGFLVFVIGGPVAGISYSPRSTAPMAKAPKPPSPVVDLVGWLSFDTGDPLHTAHFNPENGWFDEYYLLNTDEAPIMNDNLRETCKWSAYPRTKYCHLNVIVTNLTQHSLPCGKDRDGNRVICDFTTADLLDIPTLPHPTPPPPITDRSGPDPVVAASLK